MKTRFTFMLLGLFIAHTSPAQPHRLENYRRLITEKEKQKGFEQDTAYIRLLVKFGSCFYEINPDSLLYYSKKAYGYARSSHDEQAEAESLSSIGDYYALTGDYAQMLDDYQQSQALAEKINAWRVEANMLRNIGQFYMNMGKEAEALQDFQKAYKVVGETNDSVLKAYLLVDMAAICLLHNDYDQALQRYHAALQAINDPEGYTAAFIRVDIGGVWCEKKQYKKALDCFRKSLQYYRDTNDKLGRMNTTEAIANACGALGQADTALAWAMESFLLAKELKNKDGMANAGESLANLYEKKGDYRNSLYYFRLFKTLSDSLFNDDTRKKTAELQAKYVYEKKEALLKETQANRVRVLHFEIAIALVSALLLGVIVIFFLYPQWVRQFPHIKNANKEETYEEKSLTYL